MSTALDIIKQSMRLIRVLGSGDTPSDDEGNDGLVSLNQMIASWNNEGLLIYQILNETFSTVANTGTYNIATGSTWNTTRPIKIESAFVRVSGYDYSLSILTNEEYQAISNKSETSSIPSSLFYYPTYPTGVIYLYPIPTQVLTVGLSQWKKLSTFAGLTTTVSLPEGYEIAIKYNLAIELAPEYGKAPDELVYQQANKYKSLLKEINYRPIIMKNEMVDFSNTSSYYDVYTDR